MFSRCIHRRRGYTLLEMLLVLALLVTIAAISFPTINRIYASYRLRRSAAMVADKLASARIQAIDRGRKCNFHFEPGGRRFLIMLDDENNELNGTIESDDKQPWRLAGALDTGLRFEAVEGSLQRQQRFDSRQLSGLIDASSLTLITWSAPLTFHPDGTADDWNVKVTGNPGALRIHVRGLTGAVSTSRFEKL